jgi:signal transduction histidine kinase
MLGKKKSQQVPGNGDCIMTVALSKQQPGKTLHNPSATGAPGEPRTVEVSHLAHDARNWLTVLQVYCDLLRTSGTVTGRGLEWMEELSSAVERGQELVHALVDSALAEEPRRQGVSMRMTATAPFDLAVAIERRLPLLRRMAGNLIEVVSRTVAQAGATALREPEFERILLNLVGNAIEAMPEGGTLGITLEPGDSCERRSLVLRVSDTGNGIEAAWMPHIFDSGFSTKLDAADRLSRHGFGLAIVRELTMGAGGSVRVRSRAGHGTCFAVELPLLSDSLPSDAHSAVSGQRTLAVVSEMPKSKPDRHAQHNNFGANRKGTRVPC